MGRGAATEASEVVATLRSQAADSPAPSRGKRRSGKQLSPKAREEKRAEAREKSRQQLEQAVLALKSSDGWKQWLRTRSKFRRYSFNNQILIAIQKPDATQVAGYKTWQSLGRQVSKGEKAIWITAPRSFHAKEEDPKTGEETTRSGTYFVGVKVWDISQTQGDPLPEPLYQPLTGDSHAHYLPQLAAFAEEIGFSFSEEDLADRGADGYCNPVAKKIVVGSHLAPNAKVATAVHEIAHALGVGYKEFGRHDAEVIVESASYAVWQSLGLDTSSASVAYVASWDKGGAAADEVKALREFAGKIDSLAKRIEDALGLESDTRESSAEEPQS
jgi:antirestriction protein ArdC